MNRLIWGLFGATALCASLSAKIVFDKGGYHTEWQHCFSNEAMEYLHAQKHPDIDFKGYRYVGCDREGAKYIVDLQKGNHVIRMRFSGISNDKLLAYNSATRSTQNSYYCSINTRQYEDEITIEAFDRENPDKKYITEYGTCGKPRNDRMYFGPKY